jgi:hypothetical protein
LNAGSFNVLTTWPFVLALTTLIVNDAWLKGASPGLVTGKLSDFAGIAVVTLLGLSFLPRHRVLVCTVIIAGFTWWKSPWSQPFIDAVNSLLPITMARTVDFTDLFALLVMPACAAAARRLEDFAIPGAASRRLLLAPIGATTLLALMATSTLPPRQGYGFRTIETTGEINRSEVVEKIDRVARDQGLKCQDCADPLNKATYEGKGIQMTYIFTDARTVAFWVAGDEQGMFGGGDRKKLDRLRSQLKRQLAGTRAGLEFVEGRPLHEEQSPQS